MIPTFRHGLHQTLNVQRKVEVLAILTFRASTTTRTKMHFWKIRCPATLSAGILTDQPHEFLLSRFKLLTRPELLKAYA